MNQEWSQLPHRLPWWMVYTLLFCFLFKSNQSTLAKPSWWTAHQDSAALGHLSWFSALWPVGYSSQISLLLFLFFKFLSALGFRCSAQALQRVAQASLVVAHGLSGPAPCGDLSSPTRNGTWVSCIGRWILNLWTTREVPLLPTFKDNKCLQR